jgi:hypothetical protein
LVPITLRILFVLDGRISTSKDPGCFGLGLVLETLTDASFSWWLRYDVHVVRRDAGIENDVPERMCADDNAFLEEQFGFRFTPNFDLDSYDQIWFFGDWPGEDPPHPNPMFDLPKYSPLDPGELKLLAEWMDRGGGVFAVGDHETLGASMCSRIPRVRTMRKWTVEQGVPPQDGDFRNQTLQKGDPQNPDWEGDALPQTIEPIYTRMALSPLTSSLMPHAILSLPSGGVITQFPDHMHEGQVIDDDAVELDRPLGITDYNGVEYPAVPQHHTARRPRPHVIAYGRTTQLVGPGEPWNPGDGSKPTRLERTVFDPQTRVVQAKRFGLVGVYDGDEVGIGRVVVDSTWHHWFTYNLHGFPRAVAAIPGGVENAGSLEGNPLVYQGMQAYYRNIGIWLATPAQRRSMLTSAVWGVVASDAMAFPREPRRSLWEVGERVVAVIGRSASLPVLFELVKGFFKPGATDVFRVPEDVHPSEPASGLSMELAVRAIVGGVATSLVEAAADYRAVKRGTRRLLEPEAIVARAAEGANQGCRALLASVRAEAASAAQMAARLEESFQPLPPNSIEIPVELIRLRVTAERLQLTDPTDPVLVDRRFTVTVRLRAAALVLAAKVIEGIDLPPFEARGAIIGLDQVLYDGVIQSGENVVIEVVSGVVGHEPVDDDRVRFRTALDGEPSGWIGEHPPDARQAWRLWYRVEGVDTRS